MATSVYPSVQFGTLKRGEIPMIAASDIWWGTPVSFASSGDWTVVMCASSSNKPIGVARDFAQAGKAVSVYDYGNITRTYPGAGGSFPRQAYVGVVGTSSGIHPQSGVTVTYPVLGQVVNTGSTFVGSSTQPIWALGVAYESAALNDFAAFRIEPTVLSGNPSLT